MPLERPPERVGVDINIARHPIFASRSARGYRKLPTITDTVNGVKVTRTVSVGTYRDTNRTLDTFDELVFMSIYGAWEKAGCKMDTDADLHLIGTLTDTLTKKRLRSSDSEPVSFGGNKFERLRESLDKLANIGITYDQAFEKKGGWSTESITLLKRVALFNRSERLKEGGKYFELTELCLNRDICQNIKDKKFKLFYLEELTAVKSETGKLIYNRLELLGGVITGPFRRDALEFAKECGIETKHERKTIQKMKRACKELTGRILTCGVIAKCFIETERGEGNSVHRTFICYIKKIESQRAKNGVQNKVPDHHQVNSESMRIQEKEYRDRFDALPDTLRHRIEERAMEISRIKHNGYLYQTCLSEAIREFFSLNQLSNEVKKLTLRQPPSQTPYRRTADVVAEMLAFLFPPRILLGFRPAISYLGEVKGEVQ